MRTEDETSTEFGDVSLFYLLRAGKNWDHSCLPSEARVGDGDAFSTLRLLV